MKGNQTMNVVERIEKYTTVERERLERNESTPRMRHIRVNSISVTHALCGYEFKNKRRYSGIPVSENDCVVCHALYRNLKRKL